MTVVAACVYQQPSSIFQKCVYAAAPLVLLVLGISEAIGKHLNYSKFWNSGSERSARSLIASKKGMLLNYTPALFVCASSFWVFPNGEIRFLMLKSALTLHFLKRDLEVLFLHKFSAFIAVDTVLIISTSYAAMAAAMLYFHHQTRGIPDPPVDLKHAGLLLSAVGSLGNFYHHYLLSKLRKTDENGYKIPRGGLFGLVVCPHYLCEIVTFVGFAMISQTVFACLTAVGAAAYLLGRSYATRNWYLSKFEDFPMNVRALIPYVF